MSSNVPTAYHGDPHTREQMRQTDLDTRAEQQRAAARAHDHRQTEANLRNLSDSDKEALRRAGYRGDLSTPLGETSGRLEAHYQSRPASIVTYRGDSAVWMDQFSPPIRQQLMAFRGLYESDADWRQNCAERQRNFTDYGSFEAPRAPATRK